MWNEEWNGMMGRKRKLRKRNALELIDHTVEKARTRYAYEMSRLAYGCTR